MKRNFIRAIVATLGLMFISWVGTGCKHTAHGAGKDMEELGDKIQEKTE